MATDATLDDIALGEVDPAQARAALSKVLAGTNPKAPQWAYAALRAWVWKALDGRRRDPELREWFDVLRRTAAFLRTKDAALAERVLALHELVQESISVSERLPIEEVLQRRHVRDVLAMLVSAPGGRLDRSEIGRRLGLKQGNLTRVLNMVTEAGLAERAVHGKQAEFQSTRAGEEAAARLGLRKPSAGVATVSQRQCRDVGPFVRLDALGVSTAMAICNPVERQGMTLIGYARDGAGGLAVQRVASMNLYPRGAPAAPVSAGITVQGHLGNLSDAGAPAGKARNAWMDAFHD